MMGTQQRQAGLHHEQQHGHGHGHGHSHGVIQSSISLLQERFKQLQRVKEMREKKELLRIFSNHNNINNNNTATTILSTSTSTAIAAATISTTDSNNFNSSNNIPTDAAMHYNNHHEPYSNDRHHDDGHDKELQVFLPPNYYNYKPSCYSSLSSSSSPSPSSSTSPSSSYSSSSDNNHEVSLSLWPSTPPCNITPTADHLQRTTNFIRPTKDQAMGTRAFKFEDSNHYVSDVDTTLHL